MALSSNKKNQLWKNVLLKMQQYLSSDVHVYDNFFSTLTLYNVDDENIIFTSDSPLVIKYFQQNNDHISHFSQIINEVFNKDLNLSVRLKKSFEQDFLTSSYKDDNKLSKNPVTNPAFFSNSIINPRYTFDNFVVGECNSDAVRASLLVSSTPGTSFNPLFIYSKSGLGKTHLLHAIGNYVNEKFVNKKAIYITTDAFVDEFVKYSQNSTGQSLRDFFKDYDILLVDDIQFLSDKAKTSEMFFNIFNMLYNSGKQIVITSDRAPSMLKGLQERLVSRFSMGLNITISAPDTNTSLEIIKRKIVANGYSLSDFEEDGLHYLAETFSRNVRELEGALNRLFFQSTLSKDKITTSDIKEYVSIMVPSLDESTTLTDNQIIEVVAKYYGLSSSQIKSKNRSANIALARRIAMYFCRTMLAESFPHLGTIFCRDHSTVMSSVEKVGREMKVNEQLSQAINDIKNKIKS